MKAVAVWHARARVRIFKKKDPHPTLARLGLSSWRKWRRPVALTGAALLTGTALIATPHEPAEAVTAGVLQPGIAITGVASWGESWLGAMQSPNGVDDLYFCVQSAYGDPVGSTPVSSATVGDSQLAYVYDMHRRTADATTRAAISYLTHMRHEQDGAIAATERKARIDANTPSAVKSLAATFLAEAAASAGPYQAATGTVITSDKRTGRINGLGFLSDAGSWISGKRITVTLQGPAVLDATGTRVWTGTTGSGPVSLAWTATGNGTVTPVVRIEGAGRVTLTKYTMSGQIQDGLSYAGRPPGDPEEITTPGEPFEVVLDFQPEIRTQVATVFVEKGASLVDQVTAAAAAGDTWTRVNGSYVPVVADGVLYGPYDSQPPRSATVPPGAPVAATAQLTFNGPGTLDSTTANLAERSGYYTWVWTISKERQPNSVRQYIRGDATHDFGLVAETHIVPFQPVVTTVVADRVVEPGESFVDVVTFGTVEGDLWLTKRDGTPVETVWDGTLYGPFDVPTAEVTDVPPGALVQAQGTLRASGPGVQRTDSDGNRALLPGFYTWVWEMDLARQPVESQPYLAGSFATAFMIEDETSTVKHDAVISTLVRDFNVVQGGQIHDLVTITGLPESHGDFPGLGGWIPDLDEIVHTAYGPLPEQPTDDLDLSTAPVLGVATTPARNGQYLIGLDGEFQVAADNSAAGWYVIVSSYVGDDRVNAFTTSPGDVAEMAFVPHDATTDVETWLITDADEQVVAGQPFQDTAHLTGTIVEGGHLVFEAFGVFTQGVEPAESPEWLLWTSRQIPVTAAGTFRSGHTTADLPDGATEGHVYWVATYYDANGEVVARGAFGDESEITRIVAPDRPVVTTLAQPMVALGDPAHDVAYVSGPVVPESTLTFAAYRQSTSADPADDELVAEVGPMTIYHGGEYTSPEVYFDRVGTYYWIETLTGPGGEVVHVGAPRVPNETTRVVRVTTQAVERIVAGGTAHDIALIEGTPTPGSTLAFAVYRQVDSDDSDDDQLAAELPPVPVDGSGPVRSADVVLASPGTYYWVETLTGPDGRIVHVGDRRLPNETTTVDSPAGALAVTGPRVIGGIAGSFALLALGGVLLYRRYLSAALERQGDDPIRSLGELTDV